jgi:hypothetical protein
MPMSQEICTKHHEQSYDIETYHQPTIASTITTGSQEKANSDNQYRQQTKQFEDIMETIQKDICNPRTSIHTIDQKIQDNSTITIHNIKGAE